MKFGKSQEIHFDTARGAYSIVTTREHYDSQITITDEEAKVIIEYFRLENIQIGSVGSDREKSSKAFRLYPSGNEIDLNIVFPKPGNKELRLYLSARAGFKPDGNDVWFVFEYENSLWIGSMSEADWRNQNQVLIYDESEGSYQDAIQELDEIKATNLKARDVFTRDRAKAIERFELSNYKCDFSVNHELFSSRASGMPYLEAHHLIPMALQKTTDIQLDTIENIYSLCPYCHRAIHHAEKAVSKEIIEILIDKRPSVLNILNNEVSDIFNYYSVEDIL